MKVLLINGSPHKEGCTFTALNEVAKTLDLLLVVLHAGNVLSKKNVCSMIK